MHTGPLVHLQAFGRHVVVVNTLEAVSDLFDKLGAIYSARPRAVMLVELCAATRQPRWRNRN